MTVEFFPFEKIGSKYSQKLSMEIFLSFFKNYPFLIFIFLFVQCLPTTLSLLTLTYCPTQVVPKEIG